MDEELSQVQANDKYAQLRNLCHAGGMMEWNDRKFKKELRMIGIHVLVYKVRKYQSQHGLKVDDPDTVRRRYNYLCDPDWIDSGIPRPSDESPLWEHCGSDQEKFLDYKPNEFANEKTHLFEWQSCYLLSKAAFPEDAELIEEAVRRSMFEKKYCRGQISL